MNRPTLSRREVLRNGTAATGVLVIGGTATAQNDTGQGAGGAGFLTDHGLRQVGEVGNVFEIQYIEDNITLRDVQAACEEGAVAEYQGYRIAEVDGNGDAGLFVNANRNLNIGTRAEFTRVNANCGTGILDHEDYEESRQLTRVVFGSSD